MTSIFVSSEHIEDAHVAELIGRLRQEGFTVSHSPRNSDDPRWQKWYESGCREEVGRVDVFIIGITPGWDASTWMCHESEEARLSVRIRRRCYHNPANIPVRSQNMARQFLHERLPDDLGSAIAALKKD
jgi:hypothetical protein